ncbi:hypothetical protein [Novosphingobium huizhouense]|uniref:hypothetical protein n=1 Tax=Novosphingobium huizhouense TaxID=2866625 RepID=UPI001CD89023|nr:hypothetical protein [Novosphingobium huizhouense]
MVAAIVGTALLCACSDAPATSRASAAKGEEVLRVLYRDDTAQMLVTLPARPGDPPPPRDCATPMLIDPATGMARAISPEDMARRLKVMQLAAATRGQCDKPRGLRRK